MATTNFTQHNPTAANQESDATFDANSLTTGGIGNGAIMPSDWMNKRWYQDSTFVAAFAQMLAAKGYSTSDANVSTLAGVLANVLTNADQKPNLVAVPFSPTPTFDASKANGFDISLSGNVTSSSLINLSFYQIITFQIQQLGSFTFTWPANVHGGLQPVSTTPAGVNIQQFVVLTDGGAYAISSLLQLLIAAKQDALGFTPVQQGGGTGQLTNKVYVGWSGARLKGQVDGTDLGNFAFGDIPTFNTAMNSTANVAGTTYTNTTSRMRFVSVTYSTSGGNTGTMTATVNGIQQIAQDFTGTLSGGNACIQFMVPPGATYVVNISGSSFGGSGGTQKSWVEIDFGF